MNNWIKIKNYAKKYNITPPAVYQRIARGTIRYKKIKDVTYVEDDGHNLDITEVAPTAQEEIENKQHSEMQNEERKLKIDLQKQKLKNLKQDTILKQIRQHSFKQLYRRQFTEQIYQCLTDSFSDVKNYLITLKMNKEQTEKIKKIFKNSFDKFRKRLKESITKKQKQDDAEDEVALE